MGLCIRKEKEDAGSIKHHQEGQSGKPKVPSPAPKDVKVGKANQPENNASAGPAKNANNKDSPKGGFSRKKLEQLFAKYKDEGDSDPVIGPDGIEKFCTDLEISPEDVLVLVMAYHLNAQEMGYFTQAEFLDGFEKLGLDSIEAIKSHLPRFRAELDEQEQFKTIYRFAFNFAREDPAKKVVDMEIASGMLLLVMGEKYPLSKNFVDFLKVQDSYKALNMDQWMSFYEFCKVVNNDFSNYDENSAWPCIIDEWVEWRKKGDNPPEEED